MASAVAKSASRALGLVIYKCKLNGGLPFKCFTKLYDSLVWPIIEYGASIWGTTTRSCINAVQNRASRYHLGVGKYTPNLAVQGDIGWVQTQVRQWKSLGRLWSRFKEMPEGRINKRIFSWSTCISNSSASCKNWYFKFKAHMTSLNLDIICDENSNFSKRFILKNIHEKEFSVFKSNWRSDLDNTHRPNGSQSKLRSYKSFKDTFDTESYVLDDIPRAHRSALAKFRCGVAPIKIETGKYENLSINERKCFTCDAVECHVICEFLFMKTCVIFSLQKPEMYCRILIS